VTDCLAHIRDVSRHRAAADVPAFFKAAYEKISSLRPGVPAKSNSLSEIGSLNQVCAIERNASGSDFESFFFRTNSSYPTKQISRRAAETL
jgi:hypothetical protein